MSLGVAFRAFFAAISNSKRSDAIQKILDSDLETLGLPKPAPKPTTPATPVPAPPKKLVRSEALTLLAILQREARLVDLVQEPLDQYADAQVGAAARPCLKQCQKALQRVFDLQPLAGQPESSVIDIPASASAVQYQWVGESSGSGDKGRVVHPGWLAKQCELPQWTGKEEDTHVIAPIEVERP